MNIFGTLSLGGTASQGGFSTGDSTGFICYAQLVLMFLDWVLNTVTDNFLRDPLVVLVIFICQVLLLIIALIFYLMTAVNHAMKNGIHQRLLRHHQITIFLWASYTIMVMVWNVWSLKRAWPTAGEHFSFTFNSADEDSLTSAILPKTQGGLLTSTMFNTTENILADMPTPAVINMTASATTPSPSASANVTTLLGLNLTTAQPLTPTPAALTGEDPSILDTLAVPIQSIHEQIMKINYTIESIRGNDTVTYKLPFWTPGLTSVYVIERCISLLFYVSYVLGTIHVANADLMNSTDGGARPTGSHPQHNNNNSRFDKRNSSVATLHRDTDSNNFDETDDNFVRQLEDQDGDPFNNDQYEYQYRQDLEQRRRISSQDTESESQQAEIDAARERRRIRRRMEDQDETITMYDKRLHQQKRNGLAKKPMIYTTQSSSMIGMSTFRSEENPHGVTVSMDTMASGSTDELLVAEVFSSRS